MPLLFPSLSPAPGEGSDELYVDVVGETGGTMDDHQWSTEHEIPKSGKQYHCQRCLNHGLRVPRKDHKNNCVYAECRCKSCILVQNRKVLNREISKEAAIAGRESEISTSILRVSQGKEVSMYPVKERKPKCSRCRAHNPKCDPPPLKGHKKSCPYRKCTCRKCALVTSRREVMAKQIKLRRSQMLNRAGSVTVSRSGTTSVTTDSGISSPQIRRLSSPCSEYSQETGRKSPAKRGIEIGQKENPTMCDQRNEPTNENHMESHCAFNGQQVGSRPYWPTFSSIPQSVDQPDQQRSIISTETLFAAFLEYLKNIWSSPSNHGCQANGLELPTTLVHPGSMILPGTTHPPFPSQSIHYHPSFQSRPFIQPMPERHLVGHAPFGNDWSSFFTGY